MNLVVDSAVEVDSKADTRKTLGTCSDRALPLCLAIDCTLPLYLCRSRGRSAAWLSRLPVLLVCHRLLYHPLCLTLSTPCVRSHPSQGRQHLFVAKSVGPHGSAGIGGSRCPGGAGRRRARSLRGVGSAIRVLSPSSPWLLGAGR